MAFATSGFGVVAFHEAFESRSQTLVSNLILTSHTSPAALFS
jgi:hypothetical protein